MSALVSRRAFSWAFGLYGAAEYRLFLEEIESEVERAFSAHVRVLSCNLRRGVYRPSSAVLHDASEGGGSARAREVVVSGIVAGYGEQAELEGYFVWQAQVGSFHGKLKSRLPLPTDAELIMRARECFRRGKWAAAQRWLDDLADPDRVPPSVVKLREMVRARL